MYTETVMSPMKFDKCAEITAYASRPYAIHSQMVMFCWNCHKRKAANLRNGAIRRNEASKNGAIERFELNMPLFTRIWMAKSISFNGIHRVKFTVLFEYILWMCTGTTIVLIPFAPSVYMWQEIFLLQSLWQCFYCWMWPSKKWRYEK